MRILPLAQLGVNASAGQHECSPSRFNLQLGKVLMTLGVAEVVKASSDSTLKEGQHVLGYLPMAEYFVYGNEQVKGLKVLENKEKLPWSTLVGAAGMPGRTAFYGFYEIGKPKKGETIFGESFLLDLEFGFVGFLS